MLDPNVIFLVSSKETEKLRKYQNSITIPSLRIQHWDAIYGIIKVTSKENNSEKAESRKKNRIMVDPVRDSSQQKQDPLKGYNSLKNQSLTNKMLKDFVDRTSFRKEPNFYK